MAATGRRKGFEERFEARIDRSGDCHLWTGIVNSGGYGACASRTLKENGAHRIAWVMEKGPIPNGLQVLHSCDVKLCVRVDHLFLGTQKDNMQDMVKKGRQSRHPPSSPQVGELNRAAKLTDAQVVEMRRLFDSGVATQAQLMRHFNTTRANVHVIVRRKSRSDYPS